MSAPFSIRQKAQDGTLAVRDGLVFALFVPRTDRELRAAAADLLEAYLQIVGESRMTLIHDQGESYRPFTAKKRRSLLEKMRSSARGSSEMSFSLRDGNEPDVPSHFFEYEGTIEDREPSDVSSIEIWFPTEYLDEVGLETFWKQVLSLAEYVPFSSGYVSLALNFEEWASLPAMPLCRGIAQRHPGVDIHSTSSTALYIGTAVRGAYWITLLGPEPLAQLARDAAAIRAALGEDFVVTELSNGVAIRAGDRPLPGDVNRGDWLPMIRKVASLIEPVQLDQRYSMLLDDEDEWVRWQRRHLLPIPSGGARDSE